MIESIDTYEIFTREEIEEKLQKKELLKSTNIICNFAIFRFVVDLYNLILEKFESTFLKLDTNSILEISNEIFSRFGNYMDEKIKTRVWKEIAKSTIENYLVSLFISQEDEEDTSGKLDIKNLRKKIKADKILMKNSFDEKIGEENTEEILKNLTCLLEFLESSADMISLSCHSLIESTGKSFNIDIAEILINLRNDFDAEEKKSALESCKEVIDNFKDDSNDNVTKHLFEYVNKEIEVRKTKNNLKKSARPTMVERVTLKEVDVKNDLLDFGIDLSDEEDEEDIEGEKKNEKEEEKAVFESFYVPSAISYSTTVEIVMEDTMKKKSYDV